MKKAFVTGAGGFPGINLIKQLVELEWNVTALHLPGDDLKSLARYEIKYSQAEILDYIRRLM